MVISWLAGIFILIVVVAIIGIIMLGNNVTEIMNFLSQNHKIEKLYLQQIAKDVSYLKKENKRKEIIFKNVLKDSLPDAPKEFKMVGRDEKGRFVKL